MPAGLRKALSAVKYMLSATDSNAQRHERDAERLELIEHRDQVKEISAEPIALLAVSLPSQTRLGARSPAGFCDVPAPLRQAGQRRRLSSDVVAQAAKPRRTATIRPVRERREPRLEPNPTGA